MMRCSKIGKLISIIGLLSMIFAACTSPDNGGSQPDLLEQSAASATALIQQAQSTALLLQAQQTATAIMAQLLVIQATPTPGATLAATIPGPTATPLPRDILPTPEETAASSASTAVEIISVGFGVEGGLIVVQFRAPAKEAERWWQGSVSVIDEASGQEYTEIPTMPVIGPLISRPKVDGQVGNVMLVHNPPVLKIGSLVTVILGNFRFEHIPVE